MTNYPLTLSTLVPGAKISYTGVDVTYEGITWSDERTQPTKAECDAAWPQIEYHMAYAAVEHHRRERYQRETDGMFFAAQRDGGDLTAWAAAVDAIKAQLPYPEAL
jgi:hypothetical protein